MRTQLLYAIGALSLTAGMSSAQPAGPHRGVWYASWGYNAEGFAPTDMRIVQPSLGTDFILHRVAGHEDRGWTEFFRHEPTVPQYSVRIGYFLPNAHDVAVELSFEHARFIVTQLQPVRMSGTLTGRAVDSSVVLARSFLMYRMNNGANFLLFNLVKRARLHGTPGRTGSVSLLGKAGAGILIPHADNTVFAVHNRPAFQFGGFDAGLEASLRVHAFRRLYVELGEKGVYARYRGIHVNQGHADLDLWAHVTALSLGWSFSGARQ